MISSSIALALGGVLAFGIPNVDAAPTPIPPIVSGLITKQTTSNTWSSKYCYWDPAQNALTGYTFTSTSMTPDLCTTTCETKGFTYAAVEWGNTCWCGNALSNGYAIYDNECQKFACTGDKTTYCGGATAMQVFARGAAWTASSSAAASTSASISASVASASASASASVASASASLSASISASVASASASASASVASASASASASVASASASLSASVSASVASASASASASIASASASASVAAAAAAATVIPSPWVPASVPCVTDQVSARALNGAYMAGPDMTYNKCLTFCASKGFGIAGVEYSAECYCGNSLVNGASLTKPSSQCNMPCGGSLTQNCGGSNALTLFVVPSQIQSLAADLTMKAVALPAGWSVGSTACVAEGTSGRALTGSSMTSGSMTVGQCIAYCNTNGFSMAGVEYSGECYCGNQLTNGASLSLPSSQCNMQCSGDATSICGGPNALSFYVNPNMAPDVPNTSNGLTNKGCIQEVAGRALTGQRFDFADMTIDKCTAACKYAGYSMAGVEYGTECYCGNSFSNGASASAVSAQCTMACPGNVATRCGGPNAIQLYSL